MPPRKPDGVSRKTMVAHEIGSPRFQDNDYFLLQLKHVCKNKFLRHGWVEWGTGRSGG